MANSSILLLFVCDISFLTPREKGILLQTLDKDTNLSNITVDDISKMVGRVVRPRIWDAEESVKRVKRALTWMKAMYVDVIIDGEDYYPPLLREVADRPFALFCRGSKECLLSRTVSIVGTRHVTMQGRKAAEQFAHDASSAGVSVVSGLALGVDGAAHKGAVQTVYDAMEDGKGGPLGKSIAVLPCGVDIITPAMHKHLAENIMYIGGCLISEYLPGATAETWRFVHRNRIIAGMSNATLVVEAPPGSGALITAQYALEYNRDVVFHEAAFCNEANAVAKKVKEELEAQRALGKGVQGKIENTARRYVEDGAPVVKDYADFCKCLKEAPGIRAVRDAELFTSKDGEAF